MPTKFSLYTVLIGNVVGATTLSAITIARYSAFLPILLRVETCLSGGMAANHVKIRL